jgi:hypothetical protein
MQAGKWHGIAGEPANDPEHWRGRAVVTRAKAKRATDSRSKRIMLRLAGSYERFAERVEQRLRNESVSQL